MAMIMDKPIEINLGALTYHYQSISQQESFTRKIGNGQLIANPLLDIGLGNHHAFIGSNSIGRNMTGYRYNVPMFKLDYLSLTVGGYYQHFKGFYNKGIVPFGDNNLTPIVGIDYKPFKNIGILVTPAISVMYLSF